MQRRYVYTFKVGCARDAVCAGGGFAMADFAGIPLREREHSYAQGGMTRKKKASILLLAAAEDVQRVPPPSRSRTWNIRQRVLRNIRMHLHFPEAPPRLKTSGVIRNPMGKIPLPTLKVYKVSKQNDIG